MFLKSSEISDLNTYVHFTIAVVAKTEIFLGPRTL